MLCKYKGDIDGTKEKDIYICINFNFLFNILRSYLHILRI